MRKRTGALLVAFTLGLPAHAFTLLHDHTGGALDGAGPYSELVLDGAGNLYGTTFGGGPAGLGTVFKMRTDGSGFTLLHTFAGSPGDGAKPRCALVLDGAGNLYGTTTQGGTADLGTIFKVNTDGGGFALLHSFTGNPDGSDPEAGLVQDGSGVLYGTTRYGGTAPYQGTGTAFRINADGNLYSVIHVFAGSLGSSVLFPATKLAIDGSGVLFGTASANPCLVTPCFSGRLFRMDGNGGAYAEFQVVYFASLFAGELSAPALDDAGNVYTAAGSSIYRIGKDGTSPTVLYALGFTAGSISSLLPDASGHLYATTSNGGGADAGTVFMVTSSGTGFQLLHAFAGGPADGAHPYGGLVQDAAGNLYGTTSAGGSLGDGTEYVLPPTPPPAPSFYYTLAPCRVVDTRGTDGSGTPLTAYTTRSFLLEGTCGIPVGTRAVALNVTAVTPVGAGFLAAYGAPPRPLSSTVNFAAGQTRANNAILSLDGGTLNVYCEVASPGPVGTTHLLVDVVGYFQ